MGKDKIISIVSQIGNYEVYFQDNIIATCNTKEIINTPVLNEWKQIIGFSLGNNEYVKMDLFGKSENTVKRRIYWENFTNDEVNVLSDIFNLNIYESKKIREEGKINFNAAKINLNNKESTAELVFKKSTINGKSLIVIFYYDDGESRRSPKLYIHGIWEVELSKEFEKKIYS
jgi:hypothetical protein